MASENPRMRLFILVGGLEHFSPTAYANGVFSPEELRCAPVQAPGQVQSGSAEGSEGSGEPVVGFGAAPGQVQQGSGEGSGEESGRLWCRARSGSTGFPRRFRRRFQEALVQSHVRFNRVPEKIPVKVWEALVQSQVRFNRVPDKVWEALVQSQVRFNRVPEKATEKVWEALVQSQVKFNRVPEKVPEGEGSRKPWCKAKTGSTGSGEGCREGPGEGFEKDL